MGKLLTTAVQPRADVFANSTTPGLESSHASLSVDSPVLTSSPVLWAYTPPPPALPMSDIKASDTQVRFSSLTLIISTKPKKCDHSSDSASDDQHDKRAHVRIEKEPIEDNNYGSNVNTGSVLWSLSMINMTQLTNTAMLAVGTVSNMSSLCLATEPSPKPGATKQHQQPATAPTSPSPSPSIPPPVQPRPTPTVMLLWLLRTLGVWEIKTDSP